MARKKCKECHTCFTVFWYDNNRYYNCWLCQTTWSGRNEELIQVEDPRKNINIPIVEEEQQDEVPV